MFKDNLFNGFGVYFDNDDKSIYKGEWVNNVEHGIGEEKWQDSDIKCFKGDYQYGEKSGQGRLELQDGSYFEGNFIKGIF